MLHIVNNRIGTFAFKATARDIAKAPTDANGSYVVKAALGATLYQLAGRNEFQVNRNEPTGKLYSFAFSCGL